MTEPGRPSLIFTVSTVKDNLRNIRRFVERNHAAGVDHLIVFLETDDPDVVGFLDGQAGVTAVGAQKGGGYWLGARPRSINGRQRINANLAHAVLATLPSAGWLFHIDGDEVLHIDKEWLLASDAEVVRLAALEAVSQYKWPRDEVTHFKRQLDRDDLVLLHALGVIDQPRIGELFRANVVGKIGVRPRLGWSIGIHSAKDSGGEKLKPVLSPKLNILHYDAYSGEEYVRKWLAHAGSARGTGFRAKRSRTATAFFALMSKPGLSKKERARFARRLYERLAEDDFDTLRTLDMLVETPNPAYRPVPLPDEELAQLRLMFDALRTQDKEPFNRPGRDSAVAAVLREAADSVKQSAPEAAERVLRAVDDYVARVARVAGEQQAGPVD